MSGDTVDPTFDASLRLVFLDPKTGIVLWAFTEHVPPAIMNSNRDKNHEATMNKLVDETKRLITGSAEK
jgi:hypothetical protein